MLLNVGKPIHRTLDLAQTNAEHRQYPAMSPYDTTPFAGKDVPRDRIRGTADTEDEPPRVSRRLFGLSQATTVGD